MSTFVPRGFTLFQEAHARLGPSSADEFRQALYAGDLPASLMDGFEIPLPPHYRASDRNWNLAVATGRGSVLAGADYFETTRRGPILVRSDDVDRLLASLRGSENSAAPSPDAAAGPCLTSPSEACPPRDSTMDPFEAAYWNQAQVVLWICSRDRAAVRQTSEWSFRTIDDAIRSGLREALRRDADFFLLSFETAEAEAIDKLSGGKLRAFGRKNGKGVREAIPAEEWPGLGFYHNGIEASLWPERSSQHVGRPDNFTGVRGHNQAANPPFWTDVLFEREAVLKIWRDPLEEVPVDDQDHPAAEPREAETPDEPLNAANRSEAPTRYSARESHAATIPPTPKRGPKPKYDWPQFHDALDRLIEKEPGMGQSEAVRAMSEWCATEWGGEDGPGEPADSTVRQHIADHPGAPWAKTKGKARRKRLSRRPKVSARISA